MSYQTVPYDRRIRENIRNYSLSHLYDRELMKEYLEKLAGVLEINLLLTDRHGEKELVIGDSFLGFHPDVVKDPGRKLRIQNRTIGHLYVRELEPGKNRQLMDEMLDSTLRVLEKLGEAVYLHREGDIYLEELEGMLKEQTSRSLQNEREDVLTGVFHKGYFETRMKVIDRSEVVPVAVINVNINDWKFANDHFGQEESDRLITIVADILKEEAKPDYILGRIDGDVFGVLIPMAVEGEAETFADRIKDRCTACEDPVLAPSVAVGIVYKTNIEESLSEKMSDAEYEMFNNKFEIKHAPGYQERLTRGVRK